MNSEVARIAEKRNFARKTDTNLFYSVIFQQISTGLGLCSGTLVSLLHSVNNKSIILTCI